MMKTFVYPSGYSCDYSAVKACQWLLYILLISIYALFSSHAYAANEIATPGSSAGVETYPKRINFRNILQNIDLAVGEVEAILQDHQGFMWLGGRNALLRYDGYEFLSVLATDAMEPTKIAPLSQVLELFEDSNKHLWVATRSGLYKYDRDREIFIPQRDPIGAAKLWEVMYALAESPDGEILVGSSAGLHIVNTKTAAVSQIFHIPGNPESLPGNNINDIVVDKGKVWLGLDEGLVGIDWSTKKNVLILPDPANPLSQPHNRIKVLAQDHSGNIWMGTDKGVYKYNPISGAIKQYQHDPKNPASIADNITRQIYVDKRGWVWTGSDGGGISLFDEPNDRFIRFSHHEGNTGDLSSNTIRSIYSDKIGDMWIGTYPSGVNFYDRSTNAFGVYRKSIDLSMGLLSSNVEAIEEDKEGNLWIGAGGVTRYDRKSETFAHYSVSPGLQSRAPTTSFINGVIDSDGEARFSSWGHGILFFNAQKDIFEELPTDPTLTQRGEKSGTKLNDQMIWSVYEDKRKDLWIATHSNGLTRFDKKTGIYTFYPHDKNDPNTVSCPLVWTTFEDSKGRFWVGTAYGLSLMDRDKGTFKRYPPNQEDNGLANGSVLTIWEDGRGRVWFGTDGGLHLYHPETDKFSMYGTKDGFFDQGIRAIVSDVDGNLWLGTNNGIVMFNPDTRVVKNYTRHNGELIGGVATGAGLVSQRGEMIFGSRNGLFIINPQQILTNTEAPPIAITDFRIFTQKVAVNGSDEVLTKVINQTKNLTLDYTKSMIGFTFAALNYRDPDKNQFAYKLEGFDDDWREVGNQRSALYTNLPAGEYSFKVKASNNDGVWNTQGQSISLTILPPPWKTWWAYCIYVLMGLGVALLFIYSQQKKVLDERKTNRKLEIKVAERTAELENKNKELEHAYEQLEDISLSDPLTGLSNRRYLQKLMPMDIAKVQREYEDNISNRPLKKASLDLTFFILDVDFFKSVNDVHGHSAGDSLLVQISEVLTNICRESDCVIRWGGEEFIIVSRFADRDEAPLMAERIRKAIEQNPFKLKDDTILHKTCSIGFACFPFLRDHPMELSWEQVIDVADHALYVAKKSGRNRSVGLATNVSTQDANLHKRIIGNLKELVDNKELTVLSENVEELIWE
jgi:diguanylate cyclase (GGDEF)-like protein